MSFRRTFYKSFYLFFFALVLTAGVIEKEITFDRGDISFTEIEEYDFIKLEGCGSTTRKIGAPSLPRASFSLLIPQGTEVIDIEVISFDKEEIRGEYDIYPTQHPQPFMKDKVYPFVEPDKDIYSQTVPYPEKIAENPNTGSMGGYRLASVLVYPLQYLPAEKKLVFYSKIKFKITYEEKLRSLKTKTEKQNKIFKERIKNLILNPEDIGLFEPTLGLSGSLDLPADTIEYVIITTDSFASTFQELADWKTKKGIPAKVVTLDSIYANYTGADNAERVRNFIIDANSSWGTIWVLLGGQCDYEWGQEIVPRRNVYYITVDWDETDTIPTDLYFSDLDGDWDADGDGVYGESADNVDLYSDVFVGRAPVRTVAQAEEFVEKILTYEKRPPSGYQKKILLPAAILWTSYDEQLSQEAIANMVPPGDWQVSRMYERNGNLTHTAFVDSIRSGFGFAHLVGHGNEYGIYTYYADAYFDSDDLDALGNDSLLGIHNSIGCMCGAIDYVPYGDCFAEHYLTPSTGGSFSIMNSRYGWGNPPLMGPSEHIDTCFYHEIFTENYTYHDHIGVAHAFSKDGYVSEVTWMDVWAWCIYELNLFGDPEMPLWTDEPGTLTVTHDAAIPVGGSSFTVNVSDDGLPVEGALVCLYKEGEVYERGYTDASGIITLTLLPPPNSLGTMYCTVTKSNYLPYEGTVDVISPGGPWVIFEQYSVIDISGNNDGNVDPGESIELQLTVHNVGLGDADAVTGILRTEDAYVTITDSTGDFGDILADSLTVSLENFDFDVLSGCPTNHVINFELVTSDINDSTWNSFFSVPISTPDISLSQDTLDFDTVYIGYPDTLELLVNNEGGDTLFVSDITSDNPEYSTDISNFNVPPYENQAVNVIFAPTSEVLSTGTLTIESDDLNDSLLTVFLQGEGLLPPDISVSPDSLSDSLFTGETSVDTLTIYNYGSSDLIFDISIEELESSLIKGINIYSENSLTNNEKPAPETDTPLKPSDKGYSKGSTPLRSILYPRDIKLGNAFASDVKILIIESGGTLSEIQSLLLSFPDISVVDVFSADATTPSLDTLLFYDCVILASNTPYGDPTGIGNVLADYADAGGGVVLTEACFVSGWEIAGRFVDEDYMPFNVGPGPSGSGALGSYDPDHPIMEGVTTASGDLLGNITVATGAELVAEWNVGYPFVATKANVAAINIFVAVSGYWTGDIPLILHNAALWSGGILDWIVCDSTSGVIAAGDSAKIEVTFDATDLYGGDYYADIVIASNDPDESEVIVPAHLHVTGVPDITVSADTMDFGIVYTGYSSTDSLIVSNDGTDILTVSDISSDNSDYTVDITNFTVNPGEAQAVAVTCTPSTVGIITGNLTISSDDPDESTVNVFLQAEGLEPPDISVSPDSLSDSLFTGEISVDTLTIYNTGLSDLIFDISVQESFNSSVSKGTQLISNINYSKNKSLNKTLSSVSYYGPTYPNESRIFQKTTNAFPETLPQIKNLAMGGSVLIIGDGGTEITLEAILIAADYTVTIVDDDAIYDGTNPSPEEFDLVILLDGIDYSDNMPSSGQTALVNYVQNGGGFIVTEWIAWEISNGRYQLITDIIPLTRSSGYRGIDTYTVVESHPITDGVSSSFEIETGGNIGTANSGTVLVQGSTTGDAVIIKEFGSGRIVEFSSAGNYEGLDPFSNPDMQLLFINAVRWSTKSLGWLALNPLSDTIPAGDSTKVEVTFDATGLNGGDYYADIIIANNDPDESEVVVPAHLHVTGAPDIAVSLDTLDCGIVYPGNSVTDTLIVTNEGTDALIVNEVSSDNGDYTIDTTNFILAPEENQTVLVSFTPSSMGIITGLLNIESNDPDKSTVTIYMRGECLEPPIISVSPDSLSDTLNQGETSTHTLTIYNTGVSDLIFDTSIGEMLLESLSTNKNTAGNISLSTRFKYLTVGKGEEDPRKGNPVVIGAGGPDSFGYTWIDSDEEEGCQFDWVDISSTGTQITGLSDDSFVGPYPISFEFPFYDSVYTEFYISSNGFIGFGPTGGYSYLGNQPIPTSNIPNNIIAWCWDDLYPRGSVYYEDFGDRLVIQFVDYGEYGGSGRINAEVMIYRSGKIIVQYLNSYDGFDLLNNTVGIENIQGTDGLQVAFNTNYIHDSLAVRFSIVQGWLSVDPVSDTIFSGDSVHVEVTFDAADMSVGDHYANIIIASNDPENPELIVPAHLHVQGSGIEEKKKIPKVFFVKQNYPNPFGSRTTINFGCPKESDVRIPIYDVIGRLVTTLIDRKVEAGYHSVTWDGTTKSGRKVANAVYFYRMETDKGFNKTKKMIHIE